MSTRAIVLAVVGAGCVVAAGAGGYHLALRMNAPDRPVDRGAVAAAPGPAAPVVKAAPKDRAQPASQSQASVSRTARPIDEPSHPQRRTQPSPATLEPATAVMPPPTPITADPPVTDPATLPPPPVTDVPPPPQDSPKPRVEELTVKEDSVIGIRLDTAVSSETAKVEDKITATVIRDVIVNGHVAIPAGAKLDGVVTSVEHGGKFKTPGKIGIRFTVLLLSENTSQAIATAPFSRTAEPPGNEATSKIGAGAVVGGLLGALIGGKKGAAIGAGAGAAGGSAAVAAGSAKDIVLPAGERLTVKLTAPLTLQIEREERR